MAPDQLDCFLTQDGAGQFFGKDTHLLVDVAIDPGPIDELTTPGDVRGQVVVLESRHEAFLEFRHDLFLVVGLTNDDDSRVKLNLSYLASKSVICYQNILELKQYFVYGVLVTHSFIFVR